MLKNILTLTSNDLAMAFKNKTIYLVVFIPFFVFFSLKLVDGVTTNSKKITIGLIQAEAYAPIIVHAIASSEKVFSLSQVSNKEEGIRRLKEKKLDGLLLRSDKDHTSVVLVVLKKDSTLTLLIMESFSALQKVVEGKSIDWISDITPLQKGGIQKQTLPTWILMLILLVSFIIMPAQVAEEKEKKLLLGLLQTPMREIEWLIAKVLLGMILILTAVSFLHLLGAFDPGNLISYVAFLLVGSFCFSSYGIFLGFLCRSQASARTLGVIFYLPHLLPSALSDFSQQLTRVAPFLPSYQLYEPIKSILLDGGDLSILSLELIYLLVVGLATFIFSYLLMKKRWLM